MHSLPNALLFLMRIFYPSVFWLEAVGAHNKGMDLDGPFLPFLAQLMIDTSLIGPGCEDSCRVGPIDR